MLIKWAVSSRDPVRLAVAAREAALSRLRKTQEDPVFRRIYRIRSIGIARVSVYRQKWELHLHVKVSKLLSCQHVTRA